MAAPAGRAVVKEPVEVHERSQREVGSVQQREAGTPLARRHPFGDDHTGAVRPRAQERTFSGESGGVLTLDRERLVVEGVPGIVDGDRPP